VWKRRLPHLDAHWRQELSELVNSLSVGSIAFADQNRIAVEPDDVAPLGQARWLDASEDRNSERLEEELLARRLAAASGLPRMHQDHAAIGGKGCVVGIDSVEAERFVRVEEVYLGVSGLEALDETRMLLPG
jgi:hypothetical protein